MKWVGQCPSCGQWNSFVEELIQKESKTNGWKEFVEDSRQSRSVTLEEIKTSADIRIQTPDIELNRVLGGGLVPGSLVLVGGEPGIGKSTLFLQNALCLTDIKVLYISGEESEQQIKMRADRLKMKNVNFFLLTEASTQIIFQEIKKTKTATCNCRFYSDFANCFH